MNIEESILATLAYFDIFSYPLTAPELCSSLWRPPPSLSYRQFLQTLSALGAAERVEARHGYYFLPGRSGIVPARAKATKWIEKKLRIARRAAKLARLVPFLEAMFVCNTVAAGTAAPDSDIDVFIVARTGRLWTARLLTTLLLSLFRLRRHGRRIADRICLSFYAAPDALDFSSIRLADQDIYLCYWLKALIPIYDPKNTYQEIQIKNSWTNQYRPNEQKRYSLLSRYLINDARASRGIKKFFEAAWSGAYGNTVEAQAKSLQLAKIKLAARKKPEASRTAPNTNVIISDTMLKFHENDRREEYQCQWQELCQKFLISNI